MDIWDVIIIGGGPAGLTAGLYMSRAKYRTLVLEKETPGGQTMNVEWVENYPGFSSGISGAELGSQMWKQSTKYGMSLKLVEVNGVEIQDNCKLIKTTEGNYLSKTMIIASGARPKKLGVPGEDKLQAKGVIYCALCDGGQFADRVIAVAGGGDAGLTEALYLTKIASKVIVVELQPVLTATRVLQERVSANPKIEVRCGTRIEAICGDSQVEGVSLCDVNKGQTCTLEADGVLVHVGLDPNSDHLKDTIPLDRKGQILVNEKMETPIPGILAAGDIRLGSPRQIVTAVGDGATAALSADKFLAEHEL